MTADPSILRNIRCSITAYFGYYRKIIDELNYGNNDIELVKYMLHTKSFNAFSAALQLCETGLHIESYNSIRLALENAWLALLIEDRSELAMEWLTMVAPERSFEKITQTYRKKLGSPAWVREALSHGKKDKERRDKLYSVLSTKSHANVASTFFPCTDGRGHEWPQFYGPGGIDDMKHKFKNLKAMKFCFGYVLKEAEAKRGEGNTIDWVYDEMEIVNIAGIAEEDENGSLYVNPDTVNRKYQEMIILYKMRRTLGMVE
jgi:hypothetical protein